MDFCVLFDPNIDKNLISKKAYLKKILKSLLKLLAYLKYTFLSHIVLPREIKKIFKEILKPSDKFLRSAASSDNCFSFSEDEKKHKQISV